MSLAKADRPIADVVSYFADFGVPVGLLVPTTTGLTKSIMDAHTSLREYLQLRGAHDYRVQEPGGDGKEILPAWFVTVDGLTKSTASLYRPATKSGDPRIWFSRLTSYARAGNVLAVVAADGGLYVINASNPMIMASGKEARSPLGSLLARLTPRMSDIAGELLAKLRDVGSRGFVRTMRPGPTGVGFTLESMLGIKANSRRAPDYKGIEIKSARVGSKGKSKTRSNLFSLTPNWGTSPYSALRALQTFGRLSKRQRREINCTLSSTPNATFGFYLRQDPHVDVLNSLRGSPGGVAQITDEMIFCWEMARLRDALITKHHETFWVKAESRGANVTEEFRYFEVEHTRSPMVANLGPLIESGHVELDFLLSIRSTGRGERARDHGYLFKIWEYDRHLLFGTPRKYSLQA